MHIREEQEFKEKNQKNLFFFNQNLMRKLRGRTKKKTNNSKKKSRKKSKKNNHAKRMKKAKKSIQKEIM